MLLRPFTKAFARRIKIGELNYEEIRLSVRGLRKNHKLRTTPKGEKNKQKQNETNAKKRFKDFGD